ncbi:MAG: TraR/DksA C4-type zinc finger protein [Campylobacterales bacterium]|nr:TraR/DksA C4-type zinc finger protein [Campylobacterales bacterium]
MNKEFFLKKLQDLKQELQNNLTQIKKETEPVSCDCSIGDTREELLQVQTVMIEALELRRARLQKVEIAIRKLEEGSYGICIDCEEEIAKERLEARPESDLCIVCAGSNS